MGPNAGLTEVQVPAGFVTTVYDPVLRAERGQDGATSRRQPDTPTTLPAPGLPFSLVFQGRRRARGRAAEGGVRL